MTRSPAFPGAAPTEHAEIFTVPETGERIHVRCRCRRGADHEFHREGDGRDGGRGSTTVLADPVRVRRG
ncbi:hypothetical protein ACFOE1_08895 [Agromyces mediolanus]|uniref:Uncharacterized protein n=1 Tax=Agromyces mediolanus TaxID=41986 RepID=A0A918CFH0_AGRME|nr:hypothetical protein [Agromyces mediolanus]GGR18726.1 hypothetical protein GCM10010196_09820 [Agromyces mediolanus]GLJ71403.1 hypothetical protein GCM10017583_06590 [Agromyces mediolanus]